MGRRGLLLLSWILLLTTSSAFITVSPLRYVGTVQMEAHSVDRGATQPHNEDRLSCLRPLVQDLRRSASGRP